MSDQTGTTWLEERRVKNLIPQPFGGLINLAIILIISEICWYVFFSPAGYLRLYTPNVGVALVIAILMVIHWGMELFDFWPFGRSFLRNTNPVLKGIVMFVIYVALGCFVQFGIYDQVIGRFGALFFSGPWLLAGGGLGQYSQTALDNAAYAQMMMSTSIIFFTILWLTAFGYAPWQGDKKLTRSFSVWLGGLLVAMVAFVFLFYPHIAYQFYPAQIFMAPDPWWQGWAMTKSSLFHFGWMVPALVLLYWTTMFWEGRPFSLIPSTGLRGLVTIVTVVVAGIIIMLVSNAIMDWYFGTEAFEGGSTLEQPAWRWNHVAEIFMCMATAGAVLYHYFDNWPGRLSLPLRAVIRTAIAMAGGLLIDWLYYELGPIFLSTVPGIAQEGDTSLCWTIMLLILVTAHGAFFDGFPVRKMEK